MNYPKIVFAILLLLLFPILIGGFVWRVLTLQAYLGWKIAEDFHLWINDGVQKK
jgi:hypothetical protein